MKRLLLLAGIAGIVALQSCKKEGISSSQEVNMEDLVVPSGFNWATTKTIKFNIGISDNRFGSAGHSIMIYDGDPAKGANIISTGQATLLKPFIEAIDIPAALKEVYIAKKSPDGSGAVEKVVLTSQQVTVSFDQQKGTTTVSALDQKALVSAEPVCDCGSENQITSSRSGWNTGSADAGKTYCITQNGISIDMNDNQGSVTFKICAQNVQFNGKLTGTSKLIVTRGSSVTLKSNFNLDGNSSFINYGSATIENTWFSLTGGKEFSNYGTLKAENFTSNGVPVSVLNADGGVFRINGKLELDATKPLINYGKISAITFQLNGSGSLENRCSMYIRDNFRQDKVVDNYGSINVGYVLDADLSVKSEGSGEIYINGNGLTLHDGSLVQAKKLAQLDYVVKGTGTPSVFKVATVGNINTSGKFSGAINYFNENGSNLGSVHFLDGAKQISSQSDFYIETTPCNPGFGTPPVSYTKSVNYDNGGSTLIFEDNWPSKGDFDLNDIVISYKYLITKVGNKATKLEGTFTLIASGGNYKNGFGVEFPTAAGNVELGATNNSSIQLEAGQQNAVLILFENARQLQNNWNTIIGDPKSNVVTYSFTLTFKTPVSLESAPLKLNPFIFQKAGGVQRNEVHLPYFNGTSLANPILGNTDNSATANYITKDKGLPWALDIPVYGFKYPLEKVQISSAYKDISNWAQTGGSAQEAWYNKPTAGKCYPVE